MVAYAASHSAATSSFCSSASTFAASGLVFGWRGVKTVQQSSYGRVEVSKVSIFREIVMISSLSMPISGRKTTKSASAPVTFSACMVCDAT